MNGQPQRWHFSQQQNVQHQPPKRGAFYNGFPPRGPVPSRFGDLHMGLQPGYHHQQNAVPSYPAGMMNHLPSYNRFRPPGHRMPAPFICAEKSFSGHPAPGPRHQTQPTHFTGPQNRKSEKKKKNKVAKRDLPENNRFFCDACDRGYKDEEKYKTHISEHQQCTQEGCTYVAAPKLVQLHVKLQHQSGFAKKIWSVESPEDIKRWKEERKKNFPTTENIERKKAILADKIARGEIIEEKQFGHRRMHQKGRGQGQGRGQGNLPSPAVKHRLEDTPTDEGLSHPKKKKNLTLNNTSNTDHNSLGVFFAGTAPGSGSDSSDEASDTDEVKKEGSTNTNEMAPSKPVITAAGALGTLMSTYSDSEEDGEVEKTDCDLKTAHVDSHEGTKYKKEKPNRNRQKNRGKKTKNIKWQHQPRIDKSLLEKLLAKEICKERNQILQCVYYIVKKNLFQKKN